MCTIGIRKDEYVESLLGGVHSSEGSDEQLGGVPVGVTDVANRIIRPLMNFAKCMGWSCFAWLIDLTPAYDYAVHELVFGIPHG